MGRSWSQGNLLMFEQKPRTTQSPGNGTSWCWMVAQIRSWQLVSSTKGRNTHMNQQVWSQHLGQLFPDDGTGFVLKYGHLVM